MLSEAGKIELIERLQTEIDFSYNGWDPPIQVWRAGEGFKRELPYVAVDFIETTMKKFPSFSEIVGAIDDYYYEFAYCELELVTVSVYTRKYHNDNAVRGRDYAVDIMTKIRRDILAFWNDVLREYNASIDRSRAIPIKDLTNFRTDTGDRVHEYELNVYMRTDVRWHRMPDDYDEVTEERAEKAYGILDNSRFRVIYNG